MFDVGALELVLIGVVALLVVGPERLPKLARTAGLWLGRARRALTSVKEEIDKEIKAEELKEILRRQAESNPLESILEEPGSDQSARPQSTPSSTPAAASPADTTVGSERQSIDNPPIDERKDKSTSKSLGAGLAAKSTGARRG